ncbi:MAG TPA: hypothetical protein VN778_03525 [Verrucomicrobiae bacterium]|nr:hypothetical protein [Verrucomicrobiae bacterium]
MNSESESRKDTPRSVRRIVLQSSRTIEVVTYGNCAGQEQAAQLPNPWQTEDAPIAEDFTTVAGLLRYVSYKNMSDEIDRFAAALASDNILPEDIACPATPRHLERYNRLYIISE